MIRNDESLLQVLNKEQGILASVASALKEKDVALIVMSRSCDKKINPLKWFDEVV